nr:PKD domain-containing protein [Candidatus Sigynarchaeota archaeon]
MSDDIGQSVWSDNTSIYTCAYTNAIGAGSNDMILAKWSTDCSLLWNVTWGGAGDDRGYGVAGDDSGTFIYMCGTTPNTYDNNLDIVLVKYYNNGTEEWNATWNGGGDDIPFGIWVDTAAIYVCGKTWNNGTGNDCVLLKWDLDGHYAWNATWGSAVSDAAHDLWSNGTHLYITGDLNTDMMLAIVNSSGAMITVERCSVDGMTVESGNSVWGKQDAVYTSGSASQGSPGTQDALLAMWNMNGSLLWNKTMQSEFHDEDDAYSVWANGTAVLTWNRCFDPIAVRNVNIVIEWDLLGNAIDNWTGSEGYTCVSGWCNGSVAYASSPYLSFTKWIFGAVIDWLPYAQFSANITCPVVGKAVQFIFTGEVDNPPAYFAWNFGDGQTSSARHPVHVYATPGSYSVTLNVSNSHGASELEYKPNFITVRSANSPPNITLGDNTNYLEMTFLQSSIFYPYKVVDADDTYGHYMVSFQNGTCIGDWTWKSGDLYAFIMSTLNLQPGIYYLNFTAWDWYACDTEILLVNVTGSETSPVADFNVNSTVTYVNIPVLFTFNGTLGNGLPWEHFFFWTFGDGSNSSFFSAVMISHVYDSPGTYNVSLLVRDLNGDVDTKVRDAYITVLPTEDLPVVEINATTISYVEGSGRHAIGIIVTDDQSSSGQWVVYNNSVGGNILTSGVWTNATPFSILGDNLESGTYHMVLVVNNANPFNNASINITITVLPRIITLPGLAISSLPATILIGDLVSFSIDTFQVNQTIIGWYWNFGDGYFSTNHQAEHTYYVLGTFNVTLYLTLTNGQSLRVEQAVQVVQRSPDFLGLTSFSLNIAMAAAIVAIAGYTVRKKVKARSLRQGKKSSITQRYSSDVSMIESDTKKSLPDRNTEVARLPESSKAIDDEITSELSGLTLPNVDFTIFSDEVIEKINNLDVPDDAKEEIRAILKDILPEERFAFLKGIFE